MVLSSTKTNKQIKPVKRIMVKEVVIFVMVSYRNVYVETCEQVNKRILFKYLQLNDLIRQKAITIKVPQNLISTTVQWRVLFLYLNIKVIGATIKVCLEENFLIGSFFTFTILLRNSAVLYIVCC